MDHVIEKLKASYIDQKYTSLLLWLLMAPFRDIGEVKQLQQGISSFLSGKFIVAVLPILTSFFGPILSISTNMPIWATPIITGFLGYVISMFIYIPQLTSFKSDHFHTGAYRMFRKQEYELFKSAFLDPKGEFYFKGLYDNITGSKEGFRLIQSLIQDFLQNERTHYEGKIKSLEDTIEEIHLNVEHITTEYAEFTQVLMRERDQLLQEFEYVIHLLKDINTLLFRMHNKGPKYTYWIYSL